MSTDIKLSKAQISIRWIFDSWLSNLGKKVVTDLAIPSARDNLPGLVSNLARNAINKIESQICGKGAVRAGKGLALFILHEDMNDTLKILKSEDLRVFIDGVTETVKHEI